MGERELNKEFIEKGELFFLRHPGNENVFSGYGLTTRWGSKASLVGLLMIDRPRTADPKWLREVEEAFGEYKLVEMTVQGERGITCRMQIYPGSLQYLRSSSSTKEDEIKAALKPLLEKPPIPIFTLQWDERQRLWVSQIGHPNELPLEIVEVFQDFGYGCLPFEADIGVIHICHAANADIHGFAEKPVHSQWQLIKMPTAPLIRLEFTIYDQPDVPYRFESFLNIAEEDQSRILDQLANQDRLYLAFYGDGLQYRYTKVIPQNRHIWQYIDELSMEAQDYWSQIPPENRNFDQAKAEFMKRFV
jgi:hypothetical protein